MANENRFTGRAEVYEMYRPSYPNELLDLIINQAKKSHISINECVIADIGAGTGKFTKLLLEKGFKVVAVEPNPDMLEKLNKLKTEYPDRLTNICASAEQTGLSEASIDIIVCAQAFHWFDKDKVKVEWKSILKEDGLVFLIWNQRHIEASSFMKQYEQIFLDLDESLLGKQYQLYKDVGHQYMSVDKLSSFFGQKPNLFQIEYAHELDEQGLIGRVMSSSYSPNEGDEGYEYFANEIKQLFRRHVENGYIAMLYETNCYYGAIN